MTQGKGVLLYSGGLDSILAGKILLDQGIDVRGFHCILPFAPPNADPLLMPASRYAKQINLPLYFCRCGDDYISMLRTPPHGYGKGINPCIDCKIHFLSKAGEFMQEIGADFVATGEVVGQRPMSQLKHMLSHIEKESGLSGRLLRPLSAKLLKPTIPETAGIVKRELLYGISGRGRRIQMSLASKFNITEYSSPAGGCLFTDSNYARRVRDLFEHCDEITTIDLYLLTFGRHLRLGESLKIIIGRNEYENNELEKYSSSADYLLVPRFKGPVIYIKGEIRGQDFTLIRSIISKYGSPTNEEYEIELLKNGITIETINSSDPISETQLLELRI